MTARTLTSQEVANDTLVTTAETVVCTLGDVSTPRAVDVTLTGWAQLTTGVGTTTVTPRIRRGTDATGTLIDEGNPITIGAAAGGTEEFAITAKDDGADVSGATYVLTLQQAGATGNGTALQASLTAHIPA